MGYVLAKIDDRSNGNKLSIAENPKEFSAVILKSPHSSSKVINKVIEEIRGEEKPYTMQQWLGIILLFIIVLCIGYIFWPRTPEPISDNQPDMEVKLTKGETEEYLYDELNETQLNNDECEVLLKKLRKLVVAKDVEYYRNDFQKYYDQLCRLLPKHPESLIVKRCVVEAVLKYMNGAEMIGIKTYARSLKESGDSDYELKEGYLLRAIDCCDEILKKVSEKDYNVRHRFQKSELLMYKWLVDNAKEAKGKKIKKIPDDENEVGVWAREEAIRIIHQDAWEAKNAQELVRQCVEVLISNSSTWNKIWFNKKSFARHSVLEREAQSITGRE